MNDTATNTRSWYVTGTMVITCKSRI